MTIYATPYDRTAGQATGPSQDSGFSSLKEVRDLLGTPAVTYDAMLFYPGVVYSRVALRIDRTGNTG